MGYDPKFEKERKTHRNEIIKISNDVEKLKDYVIKLYYNGYTPKKISAIFGYAPSIKPINDVLIEKDIKRCANCKKIKTRSEFNSNSFISDGKKHSCKECKDFKVALSRPGNTEKEKQLMLEFYNLNNEEDKRIFIINLHKEYNYKKISKITRKSKKEIISVILESGFKKCARCGKVRHLDLFMNYSSNEDGKYFRCIICQNLEREENEEYRKLIEEYQNLDTIEDQEHFIINLYKKRRNFL